MSYKQHQFFRVPTDTLIEYKIKCLDRINRPVLAGDDRRYWLNRLEAIETELNKRYDEIYANQNRNENYRQFFSL